MSGNDTTDIGRLFGSDGRAEAEIDLRGLDMLEALERLGQGIASLKVATVRVLIDPATPTSGETLFQPVARYLLEARHDGEVLAMTPLQGQDAAGA
ncbi:MAG: hypothetical protein RLO50_05790, partial [Azospirillaceae bacterium]